LIAPTGSGSSRTKTKNTPKVDLKTMTNQKLNVKSVEVTDGIARGERELKKMQGSLDLQSGATRALLVQKIKQSERELKSLRASLRDVEREQESRKSKRKLSVF
jgi:hypothetical protein